MCLKNNVGFLLCLACALLWGGFYDFTAAVYGCGFSLLLICIIAKKGELVIFDGPVLHAGIGILICCFISILAAKDHGMAGIGMIRLVVIVVFWILWNNMERNSQEKVFNAIPQTGTCINIMAIIAWFIPTLKVYFYSGNRLGGSFQYANTYALFLLVGILVLLFRENLARRDWMQIGILLTGIILTGSRTVFILTIIFAGTRFLKRKTEKKEKTLVIVGTLSAIVMLQAVLKLDIGRLTDLSLNSSTLNGRLLYWMDALPIILKHPLGLGYMGYYFLQPQFQTGNYFTKFVHNDLLQLALDYGIMAACIVILLIAISLLDKKNPIRNKCILLLLCVHGLFDFDMQFMIMPCIMVMCMGCYKRKVVVINKNIVYALAGIAGAVYLYFSATFVLDYAGYEKLSLMMYPHNTMAWEKLLSSDKREEAYTAAEQIIKNNGMIAKAYETVIGNSIYSKNYGQALNYEQKMIQCAGYDIYFYNQAVYQLSFALDATVRGGDLELAQAILEEIQGIPDRLTELEKRTTVLAYRIYDRPVFNLDVEIEDYVNRLEGITLVEK